MNFLFVIFYLIIFSSILKKNESKGVSCECSIRDSREIYSKWNEIISGTSLRSKQFIINSIIDEIERENATLSIEMKKMMMMTTSSSSSSAAATTVRLFSILSSYFHLLKKPKCLQKMILQDIRRHDPDMTKKLSPLIPFVAKAIHKILSRSFNVSGRWIRCIKVLEKTISKTINEATLVSKCQILKTSGQSSHSIEGTIEFNQKIVGGEMSVEVDLKGFSSKKTKHGFHIHKFGDLGNECNDAGPHYNPFDKEHGAPSDVERHIGDLGNILVSDEGRVKYSFKDDHLELTGENSIIGKSIVVHAGTDDLGRGGYVDSKTTGHAGSRIGCCLIEKTQHNV